MEEKHQKKFLGCIKLIFIGMQQGLFQHNADGRMVYNNYWCHYVNIDKV